MLALVVCGCASGLRANNGVLTERALQRRLALGVFDSEVVAPRSDEVELVELARDLGLRGEAVRAADRNLQRARARLTVAELAGKRDEVREASRNLDRAVELAIDVGRWAGDADLVLAAALLATDPSEHRRAVRWAARRHPQDLPAADLAPAWKAVEDDPEAWLGLFRALEEEDRPQPTEAILDALDHRGIALRDDALRDAIRRGDLKVADRHARAIAALDPSHHDARIYLLGRAEPLLPAHAAMWRDDFDYGSVGASSRARLRQQAFPRSEAMALSRAAILLELDLAGDAAQVLQDASVVASAEGREIAQLLRARVRLEAGDPEPYRAWVKGLGRKRPVTSDVAVAQLDDEGWTASVRAAAREARARLVDAEVDLVDSDYAATLLDRDAPRRTRARAEKALHERATSLASLVLACRDAETDTDPCRELLQLEWSSEPAASVLERYRDSPWVDEHWVALANDSPPDVLRRLGPTIATLERTHVALTPAFVELALRSEIARGDADAAQRRLDRFGDLLDDQTFTHATLAILDARSGALDRDRAWGWVLLPSLDPLYTVPDDGSGGALAEEGLQALAGRKDLAAALERASTTYRFGGHAKAAAMFSAVADRLPHRAAAVIRSRAALASIQAGEEPRLDAIDRGAAAFHLLAAFAGDDEALHFREALVIRPRAAAYRGLLDERLAARTDSKQLLASARAWVPALDQTLASAQRALHNGTIRDARTFARRASAWSFEDAWELGRAGVDDEAIVADALEHAVGLVGEQTSLPEVHAHAQKAVAYIEATPRPVEYRDLHVGLLFLLGRADDGLAMARRVEPDGYDTPLIDDDYRVLLLKARKSGEIDDALAWILWRWVELGEDSPAVEALLTSPPAKGPLLAFACQQLVAADRVDEALPTCQRAFDARTRSWGPAVSLSYLLLNREPIDHAALRRIFAGKDAPAHYDPTTPPLPPGTNEAHWYQNRAAWHGAQGEIEPAAEAWLQAYALGVRAFESVTPDEAHLMYRGDVIRHREVELSMGEDPPMIGARIGYQALISGSWEAARIYARRVLASTKDEPEVRAARTFADRVLDMATLAEQDKANLRIGDPGLALAISEVFDEGRLEGREKLRREHDKSTVAALSLLQEYARLDDMDKAAPLADALLATHPDVPIVITSALPVLVARGQVDRARRLFADLAAEHRRRPSVRWAALPESVTGPHPGVPAWVRDPKRFDARMAEIDDAALMALVPRWRSHTEVAADAFFPIAHEPSEGEPLGAADGRGGWTRIAISPRASRCEAEACAEALLDALRGKGMSVLWTRQVELPAGTATDAMVSDGMRLWSIAVLPSGGRIFELIASAPTEQFAEFLPAVALLREGFAPLDRVLPAFRAAALRAAGHKLDPERRLAARREFGRRDRKASGCPIANTLADTEFAATRAEVLLDALLTAPTTADRRRLLACAKPTSAEARRIALVSLLDEDARVHAYGRAAVLHHSTRVLADVRDVLSGPLEPPLSAPDLLTREDLPPRGLVEVALALPPERGRELVERLLAGDERERTMAWVAASLRDGLIDPATVDDAIRKAPPFEATLAVDIAEMQPSRHLAALRDRLDALDTIADNGTMWLAIVLAHSVAADVARQDTRRLARLSKLVANALPRATNVRKSFGEIAKNHARALALLADENKATSDDAGALELLHARKQRPDGRPTRSAQTLRKTPLPQLLPGDDWIYARVASPGLFATTVDDLSRRLDPPDRTQRLVVDPIIEGIKTSSGFASLLEGGGLDLGKPIECAKPAGTEGFVCSATVSDRDAVLTVLGQRPYGSDAGVSIPMHLSTTAGLVPLLLSAAPAFLHPFIYDDEDEDDEEPDPVLASERLRTHQNFAGVDVEYYAIVHQYATRLSTDSERYLFLGDRLFVFSTAALAWRVLLEPPADVPSLSRHPEFARLTSGWKDGAALQAVAMGVASPLPKADVAVEVVVDGSGLSFRYAATTDAVVQDIRRAEGLLPSGAVTRVAVGVGDLDDLTNELRFEDYDLLPSDVLPPISILQHADGIAFGWYPATGDSMWKRWLAIVQRGPGVDKAARALGMRTIGPTVARTSGGLHFATRDGMLVLGSDAGLLEQVMKAALPDKGERSDVVLARGAFVGSAAAAVVAELPHTADLEPGTLRFGAAMIGIVDDVAYEASWNPSTRLGVLEGRLKLRLAKDGDQTDVVDQWLAAARVRNAGKLPRTVGRDELEGTLVYTLEVADAKAFARQTLLASPRAKAEVIDDTHLRLTVHAEPPRGNAEPLTKAKRKRMLESTEALRSDDPRIVKLSKTLVPAGTSPEHAARKILDWVHGRIQYEVTPRSLDGVEILEAGRGDCSEYARLTVSLLRASGVPAEMRDGMAAEGDEMVAHAWVGYHDGERWHEIDPTWGRMSVTAGHLPVSVVDILALISLDRLEITRIDAKSRAKP